MNGTIEPALTRTIVQLELNTLEKCFGNPSLIYKRPKKQSLDFQSRISVKVVFLDAAFIAVILVVSVPVQEGH